MARVGPLQVPLLPVAIMTVGGYLAWFGVHYWRSDTSWPSDPIKAVLQGKPIPAPTRSEDTEILRILPTQQLGPVTGQQLGPVTGQQLGPVGRYSHAQLIQLWISAGGDARKADLAAAIAQAESSGRPQVTSPNPDGGTNVGLWQLDTKGVGAGHTITQLQDPMINAQVTVIGSGNGTRWTPWETYNTGAYKQYLGT